ncbi:MAG: phage tail tape measure protein [Paracoccus sp. (in: a-proteobacteria)]|uniref:phage tail tape measure protein n=1 Tax=Paracoccus sp. TaxID=267 RepID=UPI003918741A
MASSQLIGRMRAVLGLDDSQFQAGLRGASASIENAGRSIRRAGRNLSVAITAPLAGFGALSLRTAGDFEASMNRVEAASGASADEMQRLEAEALKMGETTQFKASQAADTIEVLAKNGLDASQILGGALNASMLLAAATGAELAESGDLATDVMLQFGKEAGDLTGLVDGMTGVMLASKFSFDDYRLAIAQAGGVAGGLGVSFEDFNAAIAGTSSLFASGSDAGTSFKTFLQRLVPASAPAAAAIRELGLEFFEADGSMKDMNAIAQELQEGLAGLSDEARNDALSTIFGTDALRTAIGLAEQGADGIDRLKASIADASATEQAEARLKGFNGEMLKLQSAMEALRIAIGNSGILEFATDLAKRMTEVILRLKDTNPEFLKTAVIVGAAAAALGPLLIGFGLLLSGLGPLIAILKGVSLTVAALGAPFTLAAVAIGAAAVAVVANWDSIGPWFKDLAGAIGRHLGGMVDVIDGLVTGDMARLVQGFKDSWGGLRDFWSLLWKGIVGVIEWGWEEIFKPITDWIGITEEVERGWQRVETAIDTSLKAIVAAFEWAWEKIEPIISKLTTAWDRLTASRDGAISSGYDPSSDPGDAGLILPPTPEIGQGLAGGTAGIRVRGATDGAAYREGFRDDMGIQSPSRRMIEYGEYISQGLGIGIANGQPYVAGATASVGQSILGTMQPYFSGVLRDARSLTDVFDNIKSAFANMLSDMSSRLMSSGLSRLFTGMIGAFDPLAGALRGAGLPAIPALAGGGKIIKSGLFQINEAGGEARRLASGDLVFPHDLSKEMAQGGGQGGADITYAPTYNISSDVSSEGLAQLRAEFDRDRRMFASKVARVMSERQARML